MGNIPDTSVYAMHNLSLSIISCATSLVFIFGAGDDGNLSASVPSFKAYYNVRPFSFIIFNVFIRSLILSICLLCKPAFFSYSRGFCVPDEDGFMLWLIPVGDVL